MKPISSAALLAGSPCGPSPSETLEDGTVVLLRPQVREPQAGLAPEAPAQAGLPGAAGRQGAFIWGALDGRRTVQDVCDQVRERFGAEAEPVEERTLAFVHQMASGEFVRLAAEPAP